MSIVSTIEWHQCTTVINKKLTSVVWWKLSASFSVVTWYTTNSNLCERFSHTKRVWKHDSIHQIWIYLWKYLHEGKHKNEWKLKWILKTINSNGNKKGHLNDMIILLLWIYYIIYEYSKMHLPTNKPSSWTSISKWLSI